MEKVLDKGIIIRGEEMLSTLIFQEGLDLSGVKFKLLKELSRGSSDLSYLSEKINKTKQTVLYHLSYLREKGIVEKTGNFYRLKSDAISIVINPKWKKIIRGEISVKALEFFYPFVSKEGYLNCLIAIESPFPHGPSRAVGKYGFLAAELCLFLGRFVRFTKRPISAILDAEVIIRDLLEKENLILVGSPIGNHIIDKSRKYLKIEYRVENGVELFYSSFTGKEYRDDAYGLVCKIRSPWNSEKWLLIFSGYKGEGTKAAILSLTHGKLFDIYKEGKEFYSVVLGVDKDSDGRVDDIEILEYHNL